MKTNDRSNKTNTKKAGMPDIDHMADWDDPRAALKKDDAQAWDIFRKTMEKERADGNEHCPEAAYIAQKLLTPYILGLPYKGARTTSETQKDLLQQAYLLLSEIMPKYDRTKSSFKTYAYPWLKGLARDFRNDGVSDYQLQHFKYTTISMNSPAFISSPNGRADALTEIEAEGCSVDEVIERMEKERSSELLHKIINAKEADRDADGQENTILNAAAFHLLLGGMQNMPDDIREALECKLSLMPACVPHIHPLKKEKCDSTGKKWQIPVTQLKKMIKSMKTDIYAEQNIAKDRFLPEHAEDSDSLSEKMQRKAEEAVKRVDAFRRDTGIANQKSIIFVKKRILQNDGDRDSDSTDPDKRKAAIAAVRYIVEEIMGLTPAEYDAIYSTALNRKCMLQNPVRRIISFAPRQAWKDALFDNKAVLFRMCWPEYYAEQFPQPNPMRVFHCTGNVRGNLIRAARIKEPEQAAHECRILSNGKFSSVKTGNDPSVSGGHGRDVDRIIYQAMRQILPLFEMTTPELFLSLAKPKQSGWSKYGFVKVIEARGCYQTPLDFYMFNSPPQWQMARMDDYMKARRLTGLAPVNAIDAIYEAYQAVMKKRH